MVNKMSVVEMPQYEMTCEGQLEQVKEKVSTLEKTTDELNNKLNQRDAELKICYVNICLLVVVIVLMVVFKIVKKIMKKASK